MDKRGTHVGMVISFAVFVIFLVFLYSAIEPAVKIQKDKQSLLDYLESALIEQTYAEITTFTIMIDETINPNKDCLKVQNIIGEITNETDLIIKDEFDNVLNYLVQGQALIIGTGYFFSGFLKFYYSEDLPSSPSFEGVGCEPITGISVGLVRTETNIFETKIIDLINEYENNYESLKEELNIPAGSEFGFSFTYSNGTIIETQKEELSTSVYAKEIPIQYVDEEASINFGFMNIWVW